MSLNWKRISLLLGFIATVILIGYGLYFVFLRPAIPTPPANVNINAEPGVLPPAGGNVNIPTAGNINGALPGVANVNIPSPPPELPAGVQLPSETASGGLTKTNALTSSRAFQPTIDADGQSAIYYDKTTGLFYRINAAGQATPLTSQLFFEVENVTWSPDKKQAVLEYPDGSNVVYNFATGKQVTLPKHWKDFDFSPDGKQLVLKSMGLDEENRWLAVASADGSQAVKIEHLGNKDSTVYPSWSNNNQIIAMYTEDQDFNRQNLFFVGLNGENFKSMAINGRGFQNQWSTNGDKLLYSVYSSGNEYKPTLWIVEASGDRIGLNRKSLQLDTWADKCDFADNDLVYCAVPRSLPEGAGIFPSELDNSAYDIYQIDLKSGFRSKVAIPEGSHNIDNVIVTADGNYLYFTNQNTGQLYNIRLK
ncbi:hypothetical protein HYZ76_01470 [Candidatus Falkowbacteria bacterium]|nr:hypothetical protein [Candidatus Falkowbacteria bacterium]